MKILLIIMLLNGTMFEAPFETRQECEAARIYYVLQVGPDNVQRAWCQPVNTDPEYH